MIDEVKVSLSEPVNGNPYILIQIYLKTSDINSSNMYEKGFDPHYLVDIHIARFLKYLGIPKTTYMQLQVFNSDMEQLIDWSF